MSQEASSFIGEIQNDTEIQEDNSLEQFSEICLQSYSQFMSSSQDHNQNSNQFNEQLMQMMTRQQSGQFNRYFSQRLQKIELPFQNQLAGYNSNLLNRNASPQQGKVIDHTMFSTIPQFSRDIVQKQVCIPKQTLSHGNRQNLSSISIDQMGEINQVLHHRLRDIFQIESEIKIAPKSFLYFIIKQMCDIAPCNEKFNIKEIVDFFLKNILKLATPSLPSNSDSVHCTCQSTNCQKRYCACFKSGKNCDSNCTCINCKNINMPKLALFSQQSSQNEITGCRCRKECQKRYCECKRRGINCSSACECVNCHNDKNINNSEQTEVHNQNSPIEPHPCFFPEEFLKLVNALIEKHDFLGPYSTRIYQTIALFQKGGLFENAIPVKSEEENSSQFEAKTQEDIVMLQENSSVVKLAEELAESYHFTPQVVNQQCLQATINEMIKNLRTTLEKKVNASKQGLQDDSD